MPNLFIGNPELLIFSTVFLAMFMFGYYRNSVYCIKVADLTKKLNLLIPDNIDKYADVQGGLSIPNPDPKYGTLSLIAEEFTKGYDFIVVDQPIADSRIPIHKHRKTNELIYVIKGKVKVLKCNNKISEQECIDQCKLRKPLGVGDWIFIKSGTEHCVEVISPARYIIIAKPPLFSRIGKFYEFLFKKKNK